MDLPLNATMPMRPASSLERQLAATLDWWRLAGVEHAFSDKPKGWLEEQVEEAATSSSPSPAAQQAAAELPAIGGPRSNWPHDLAQLRDWWMSEPTLDLGGIGPRVAPRGQAQAELLVLVPMPEEGDGETLLAGREGMLLSNMLAAMSIAPEAAYLAAALPRRMVHPDWSELESAGLGAVLQHHLALAGPKRLMVLGTALLPLIGHKEIRSPAAISETVVTSAHAKLTLPTIIGYAPDRLLANSRQRALFWRRWLDWTEN